jgi:hypothetical protein
MPVTYEPIATTTVTTAVSSVTFSSIPNTYTDLVIASASIGTSNGFSLQIRFNSDSGTNYSRTTLSGYFTSSDTAGSTRSTNATSIGSSWQVGGGTGGPSPHIYHINNYANSNVFKTVLFRANPYPYSGFSEVTAEVGLWRNTNAITSIEFLLSMGNFATGSIFTLYGIKAA